MTATAQLDATTDGTAQSPRAPRHVARWFSWLLGVAMFAAVVVAALHFSEERQFVRIAERAQPWWLLVALALQALTYLAQGETWRVVTRAAAVALRRLTAYQLSLAKLFVDQALPTGGISGTVVVARALEHRGVPRPVVVATVVVDTVSYYVAYVLTLAAALLITILAGHANELVLAAAFLFVAFSIAVIAAMLALAGRKPRRLARIPLLAKGLAVLEEADPRLVHRPRVIARATAYQLALVLLDAATMWVLVRALGEAASPTGVFASFMIASLMRTLGIFPGGLGTFEAASVLTLKLVGIPVAVALAATLLFRGLTFWLPMVPGLVFSRAIQRPASV